MTWKILSGRERVDHSIWWTLAAEARELTGGPETRQVAGLYNIQPLENARAHQYQLNFYTLQVIPLWNATPNWVKSARTPREYRQLYSEWKSGA